MDNIFNIRLAPATLHAPFSASGAFGEEVPKHSGKTAEQLHPPDCQKTEL